MASPRARISIGSSRGRTATGTVASTRCPSSNDSTERRALVRDLVLEPSVRGLNRSDGLGHPILREQEEDAHASLRGLDDRREHAELDPRPHPELLRGDEARDIECGDYELFR